MNIQGERILVMAHAHPDFSLGGGEIAAYNLFKAYRDAPGVESAWFLGRVARGGAPTGALGVRREHEYTWDQGIGDWHLLKAAHRESLLAGFTELLRALRPTIVHLHHYMHLGIEVLRVIRQVVPDARIVVTLHEYMAICRNNGQMIKVDGKRLCTRATPEECHACFPQHTAEDFWLRRHFLMGHFDLVDRFVSPSHFLRQRYVEWGIAPERIDVIENGQSHEAPLPPRPLAGGEARNRFGFFGQVTPFKGVDVLLEALAQLPPEQRRGIVLEVHGANLELQTEAYRDRVEALRGELQDEGVLQWVGPYQPSDLRGRMAGVDWVVVPSIWWENSPMVIQEAFVCGRPLLVSDIGGMAEKVRHGIDGLHVGTGNRMAWGSAMSRAASDAGLWDQLRAGIRAPADHAQIAASHLAMFRERLSTAGAEAPVA